MANSKFVRIKKLRWEVLALKALKRVNLHVRLFQDWLRIRSSTLMSGVATTTSQRRVIAEILPALTAGQDLIIFDIGAHTGEYSQALARVPNVQAIYSFEPNPSSYKSLESAASSSDNKIRPVNTALGNQNGAVDFYKTQHSDSSSLLAPTLQKKHFPRGASFQVTSVQIARLDDVVADRALPLPDIIKMDVQGFEEQVIAGGMSTFSAARWCLVELSTIPLYENAPIFNQLFRRLDDIGFQLYEITDQWTGVLDIPIQMNALLYRGDHPSPISDPT